MNYHHVTGGLLIAAVAAVAPGLADAADYHHVHITAASPSEAVTGIRSTWTASRSLTAEMRPAATGSNSCSWSSRRWAARRERVSITSAFPFLI